MKLDIYYSLLKYVIIINIVCYALISYCFFIHFQDFGIVLLWIQKFLLNDIEILNRLKQ